MSVILAHGSVETSTAPEYINGLLEAVQKGSQILQNKQHVLDAVEAVVNELEDNPLYNAGLGSVLNRDGIAEMDGAIMDGQSGRFAAVAAMRDVRHAISVARRVMEETKHVVLAGEGATQFAREKGFPADNCITEDQLKSWQLAMRLLKEGQELDFSPYTGLKKETDTVGCVILDNHGKLAAGSSTGGSFLKLPGRVGDTPFIGGGIFASEHCAIVCTGRGEAFIKTLTAKYVDDQIRGGEDPETAACRAIERLHQLTGETGGIIVVDALGRSAAVHNSYSFPVVRLHDGRAEEMKVLQI
ncbi:isoaspartyl peptidase/L-asparaginase family protein [Brevibacillus sp. B_LB10_24]|uniref:isoaspartyl peptidase/L-asparaginase family protein n=1 Tax=Brevibacillus sp. B_LB10_24 TaxID=3380645 RepID=UPI0038B8E29D